eukprot:TRINITY_DN38373_c0_g1_i2.p1 TRINITY_DN38373_c0_g1~~TRINITY_DN38373_c0_g1_i2.p1  ORF type:complete len:335 (+),score=30.48 TRINITY_DN38373_c0_g1_i2:65-1069(+)
MWTNAFALALDLIVAVSAASKQPLQLDGLHIAHRSTHGKQKYITFSVAHSWPAKFTYSSDGASSSFYSLKFYKPRSGEVGCLHAYASHVSSQYDSSNFDVGSLGRACEPLSDHGRWEVIWSSSEGPPYTARLKNKALGTCICSDGGGNSHFWDMCSCGDSRSTFQFYPCQASSTREDCIEPLVEAPVLTTSTTTTLPCCEPSGRKLSVKPRRADGQVCDSVDTLVDSSGRCVSCTQCSATTTTTAKVAEYPKCKPHADSVWAFCGDKPVAQWGVGPEGEERAVDNCNHGARVQQRYGTCDKAVQSLTTPVVSAASVRQLLLPMLCLLTLRACAQ